jgi:hypothetical protein
MSYEAIGRLILLAVTVAATLGTLYEKVERLETRLERIESAGHAAGDEWLTNGPSERFPRFQ